jgi:hypothetical protein
MNLRLKDSALRCITIHILGNRPTVSKLKETKQHISNVKHFIVESIIFGILAALVYFIAAMVFSL